MIRYTTASGRSTLLQNTRSSAAARDLVNGYTDPAPRMLPDVVPVPVDFDIEPRESFLAPRRVGAGSVASFVIVVIGFIALCMFAAFAKY